VYGLWRLLKFAVTNAVLFCMLYSSSASALALPLLRCFRDAIVDRVRCDVVGGFLMGQIQSFQASIAWLYLGLQPSFRANQNKGKPALSYLDALKIINHLKVNVFLHSR
jgi:hypothetical protein